MEYLKEALLQEVLTVHERVLRENGGASGIRDLNSLDSAVARIFQTFDGDDLYPDACRKAAALIESLVINHPFIDGNKRTGIVVCFVFLLENGMAVTADENARYDFVVSIAAGILDYDAIHTWLVANTKEL